MDSENSFGTAKYPNENGLIKLMLENFTNEVFLLVQRLYKKIFKRKRVTNPTKLQKIVGLLPW